MTRLTNVAFVLCLLPILTGCPSQPRKSDPLPVAPEVIHVDRPRESPCSTTIPAFAPKPGTTSDGLDEAFVAWQNEAKLILRCWMTGAPKK